MIPEEVGKKQGFRSGLEAAIARQIEKHVGEVRYEETKIVYIVPEHEAKYTPDFVLPNGIIVETKGRFVTADRQKHLLIKKQFPDLDIRFVFSNPRARISKQSATTYAAWCEKHEFQYAKQWIPEGWFQEVSKGEQ